MLQPLVLLLLPLLQMLLMLLLLLQQLLLLLPEEQWHGSPDGPLVGQIGLPLVGLRSEGQSHHVVARNTLVVRGRWRSQGSRSRPLVVISPAVQPQDFSAVGYIAAIVVVMDIAVSSTALGPLPGIFINLRAAPQTLRLLKSLDLLLQIVATAMQLLPPVDRLALGVAGGLAAVRRQRLMDHISPIA